MSWIKDNKPFAVFLVYVLLLILFIIGTAWIYHYMPEAGELKGFLIGGSATLLKLTADSAKDFGLDGKPDNLK